MKITGLDGREYNWNPSGKESSSTKTSNLHKKAKKLLDILLPYDRILSNILNLISSFLGISWPSLRHRLETATKKNGVE